MENFTFRKMRRTKQELTREENEKILESATYGVLAVNGDGGYPYAVPVNFVWSDGALYFHCAKEGHKIDAIKRSGKVSFSAVAKSAVVPQEFATDYYSITVFGKAEILSDKNEMINALRLLNKKLAPDYPTEGEDTIRKDFGGVCVVKIIAEHITGKAAIKGIRDTVK